MTAIWQRGSGGWETLKPASYRAEAELHDLVEEGPQLLPLSGSPSLAVVGREVPIGGGYADLVAVEPDGRVAIIEVKLARNSESRRAVIAQVLGYAAYLRGTSLEAFERDVVGPYLVGHELPSVAEAIRGSLQDASFDAEAFNAALTRSLELGSFRLVLVLDEAPPELVHLVGYLEMIGEHLVIDLVTVRAYEVGGRRILVPQRVDPAREPVASERRTTPRPLTSDVADGGAEFERSIADVAQERQQLLRELLGWARGLERDSLARLYSYRGKHQVSLLPRLQPDQVGLVTIWNTGAVSLWRSVFSRKAPASIERIEAISGGPMGAGTSAGNVGPELLQALTAAYREATKSEHGPRTDQASADGSR